jgi:signal transduction histidine kinase
MERNGGRLEGMIASVADSGRSDCAAAPAEPAEVSLGNVVEGILAVRRFGRQPGSRIDVRTGPGPLPRAIADHDQVHQVLANLVDNATHSTPDSGWIEVRLAAGKAPGTVTRAIADSGFGVPDDEIEQVFEFGFRGAAATESGVPGIGLGLWICRELVERNGGQHRAGRRSPSGRAGRSRPSTRGRVWHGLAPPGEACHAHRVWRVTCQGPLPGNEHCARCSSPTTSHHASAAPSPGSGV